MSTHSLTIVKDNLNNTLVSLYGQYDGYPNYHGKNLYKFLVDMFITNGLAVGANKENIANGAGCLAAQLVSNFKTEPGDFYLINENQDCGEDYRYIITVSGIGENQFNIKVQNSNKREIFSGDIKAFGEFISG